MATPSVKNLPGLAFTSLNAWNYTPVTLYLYFISLYCMVDGFWYNNSHLLIICPTVDLLGFIFASVSVSEVKDRQLAVSVSKMNKFCPSDSNCFLISNIVMLYVCVCVSVQSTVILQLQHTCFHFELRQTLTPAVSKTMNIKV